MSFVFTIFFLPSDCDEMPNDEKGKTTKTQSSLSNAYF